MAVVDRLPAAGQAEPAENRYEPEPHGPRRRADMGWPTPECGTDGGYQRHRRNHEDACAPCKAAHNETIKQLRERKGSTRRTPGPEHGTRAAYARERRAWRAGTGPEPCDTCKAANAAARRAARTTTTLT